jgi:hypothetical protein
MWNILFYEKADGTAPVQEFLDKLPAKPMPKPFATLMYWKNMEWHSPNRM